MVTDVDSLLRIEMCCKAAGIEIRHHGSYNENQITGLYECPNLFVRKLSIVHAYVG